MTKCKTHPEAPHGFDRNASHSEDRYVCECESWTPPPKKYPSIVIRASAEQREKFYRLGGAEWLRKVIDRAKEHQPKQESQQ